MLAVLDVGIGSLTAPRAVFRFGVPSGRDDEDGGMELRGDVDPQRDWAGTI
jgi:hypothetical protein